MGSLPQILALYRRDLRAALRDRTILVSSVIIPIFLYPTLIWLIFTGVTFVQGQVESLQGRVAITGAALELPELAQRIEEEEDLTREGETDRGQALLKLRAGELDAVVAVEPAADDPPSPRIVLHFDSARDRSGAAKSRIEEIVRDLRGELAGDRAREAGIAEAEWALYELETENVASSKEMGAFLLSMMLPLILVIIIAIGTMAPAVDATAGERERSTWETSLSLALPRGGVALAKYLFVATLGTTAGVLNMAAMVLSMRMMLAPILGERADQFRFNVSFGAIALLLAGIVAIACLLAAVMMIMASLARTFREGQSMVVPIYLMTVIPLLALQDPGIRLDLRWALVPVLGVLLMLRDALNGNYEWGAIALTLLVQAAAIALSIAAAARLIEREEFLLGTIGRRPLAYLRRALLGGREARDGR